MSELKNWLKKNGYLEKSKDVPNPTHLLLDGGKVYLPKNMEKKFIENYSNEMTKNCTLYYVETRPKIFKYMIDLDIGDDHYWNREEIMKIVKYVNSIVNQFYDYGNTVICCTAPLKHKKKSVHTGIHLIWPKIFVNVEIAMMFRKAILQKIEETMGKRDTSFQNSWEDAFDELIYTRNGYRMVGSDKLNPKTRIPENRLYQPLFAIDINGERTEYIKKLMENTYFLILETSIRYIPLKNPKCMNPTRIPDWASDEVKNPVKRSNIKKSLYSGAQEFITIDYFIRKHIPEYSREKSLIRDVRINPDGSLYVSTDSRYCMNIGRDHNSCGVYFHVTREGLFQKCFCPCDNLRGRKHGYCRDFISSCYKIPKYMSDILFPSIQFRTIVEKENKDKTGAEKEEVVNVLSPFDVIEKNPITNSKIERTKEKVKEKERDDGKKKKKKKNPREHYKHDRNKIKNMKSDCDKILELL